jgi:arginyl-tRNA synthetase
MVREEIKHLIEEALKRLYSKSAFARAIAGKEIEVEPPARAIYGDYASNIAMVLKKNPQEIAKVVKLATRFPQQTRGKKKIKISSPILEKIEVRGGFINFFLSEEYLQKKVGEILKKNEKFGKLNIGKNKKTNIEFISANPTGELHIGNGRGAFFGDVLANVLERAGYKVLREYYINDAKTSTQIQELGRTALGKGKSYLTPYLKHVIQRLTPYSKKVKSESEAGYLLGQNIFGDVRSFIEEKLKIKFDLWASEQNLYRQGRVKKVYDFLKSKNLVYKRDNAFWLDLSGFNQKDEVLIRRNGQSTYFLTDIAYHDYKIKRGFKKLINIWGADHQGHVAKIKAAAKILGYQGDLDILISQVVRLKRGKISKRKGKIVTLVDLLNEVGLDVVRFFYLTKSLDTQMEFDLELAKKQSERNPVYYVQYAHARICSILRKIPNPKFQDPNLKLLVHPSELNLIKQLIRLPEIIEETAKNYQAQRLPQYSIELATAFHQFYRDCKVLAKDRSLLKARLALVLATKIVLKNTLALMGISAPEKM